MEAEMRDEGEMLGEKQCGKVSQSVWGIGKKGGSCIEEVYRFFVSVLRISSVNICGCIQKET